MTKRVLVPYREAERLPAYLEALKAVGIEPLPAPVSSPLSLKECAGLLLTGGRDVDPALYGEERAPETDLPDAELDTAEMGALAEALERDLPVFAICRGHQLLNVFRGGTLIQHLPGHRSIPNGDRSAPVHPVRVADGTLLSEIAGLALEVNSRHHQAVKTPGRGLRVSGVHPEDGTIEAMELPGKRFVVAVQWHPEDQIRRDAAQLRLFQSFAAALDS